MIISANIIPGKKYSRIISLVPSQTELLSYLGLDKEVVGITKFCIHPETWFRAKTRVGGTKNIHMKIVQQLSPDLIIANKEENVKEQIEELAEKYDVWVTDVKNLPDALKMIIGTGKLTMRTEAASRLAFQINEGFDKLKKNYFLEKIAAAYFIWKAPYMVVGSNTFIDDMMKYCGLENVFSDQERYPQISAEQLKGKSPQLILLSSEPYPFKEKHREEMQKEFPGIHIRLVDGEMFSWYGNRLLKSVEYFQAFKNNG